MRLAEAILLARLENKVYLSLRLGLVQANRMDRKLRVQVTQSHGLRLKLAF